MKKLYHIVLKGNEQVWVLNTMQHPEDLPTFQEEGLPIVKYPFTTKWDEWKERLFPNGKLHSVDFEGQISNWSFLTYLTTGALKDMKDDGIDCFYEVANIVPKWVASAKLVRPWCFFQDLINFRWRELFLPKDELL